LCALPLTQHYKIWEVVSERTKEIKEGKIGKHILERYLKLNQDFMEDYVEYLKSINDWREASSYLAKIINDDRFVSSKGKSHYEFCMELCKMLSTYPDICIDVDGEKAIRYCIGKYTDEVGNLWVYLAEYYVRQGLFEKGRDMFEQALEKVSSARDFGIVYSAYLKFEEELLTLAMEDQDVEEGDDEAQNEDQVNSYLDELLEIEQKDRLDYQAYRVSKEELSIKRVESLIERREILLNSCLIRQNPNSIDLWTKRLTILESDKEAYQRTFHECLLTVDPFKADGKLSSIWVMFAEFYEKMGDIVSANKVFWKAVSSVLKNPEEYVNIWVSWIETLLRVGAYKDALDLIRYPLTQTINEKKQNLVYSNKLWSLYLDLEINFGNRETVRAVYMKMIDLAVITPLNLLNFAYYLIENDVSSSVIIELRRML
jgi:pre-mRNA-splicing factor SYF1